MSKWPVVKLRDVCQARAEVRDPAKTPDKPFVYVDISSIDNERKIIAGAKTLLGKFAPSRARKVIRTDDVLVSTTRPNLNAVALVPPELNGQVCSTGFCVLRSLGRIQPVYLFHYVQSAAFVRPLVELTRGALYPAVKDGDVLDQVVLLPPVQEQNRIAGKLSAAMEQIRIARECAGERITAAGKLRDAALREILNSEKAQRWDRAPLQQLLISDLTTGISKRGDENGNESCLTLSSVRNGVLDFSAAKRVRISDRDAERSRVRAGAFYIVRGNGNRSLVGRGAFAPPQPNVAVLFPDLLIQAELDSARVDREFFRFIWDSAEVRGDIEARSVTAAGIFKINLRKLSQVRVPLPVVAVQRRVAQRLRGVEQQAGAMLGSLAVELTSVEKLAARLLAGVFGSGE